MIRLGTQTDSARGEFEGSVEEADTGKRLKSRCMEELPRLLAQSFEEALRWERELNQRKEREGD